MRPITALGISLAVALPWYVWVGMRTDGEFLRGFFLEHNLSRATRSMEGHNGSILFYPLAILAGFFPWSGLLVPALAIVRPRTSRADLFVLCWLLLPLLFFSLAGSKLPGYVLPCLPPLALWIGRAADRLVNDGPVPGVRAAGLVTVLLAAFIAAAPIVVARAGEPAWASLMPVAAWCVLMALLFSSRLRAAPAYALRVLRVGAAGLLVLLTGAAPPILRARESGRDLFLPARGREVLAWGAWRTAWMAGYFYNDGRVLPVEGMAAIRQRLSAGPVLVMCGPAECRILTGSSALRTRVLAEGPRGNALVRVEEPGLGLHPLQHLDHGAAPRRERVRHLVHELAHEEDPAAVGLQQVLLRQRIGNGGGVETLPLVLDADLQGVLLRGQDQRHALVLVPLVSVLDGVDDRLAHRDAQIVRGVLVEAGHLRRAGEDRLHHLDHVEAAGDVELDGPQAGVLHRGSKSAEW